LCGTKINLILIKASFFIIYFADIKTIRDNAANP